jgi:ATP synthase protein I
MNDKPRKSVAGLPSSRVGQIFTKVARTLGAQDQLARTGWFELGMKGLVGWSIAVPMLLGAGFGVWLDAYHPASYSWTLALILVGLLVGCLNAWHWLRRADKDIHGKPGSDDVC